MKKYINDSTIAIWIGALPIAWGFTLGDWQFWLIFLPAILIYRYKLADKRGGDLNE